MNGSIYSYKNSNGKTLYKAYYRIYNPKTGLKTAQKTKSGFKTKKDAKAFLTDVNYKLQNHTYVEDSKITLGGFLLEWLESKAKDLKQNTINGYRVNIKKHINPNIGNILIQKLTTNNINNLYSNLKNNSNLKGITILYVHRVLKQALQYAYDNGLIFKNVANNAKVPKIEKFKNDTYDLKYISNILTKYDYDDMHVPIALAGLLGLRRGEVLGLTWRNINFEKKLIHVCQQVVTTDNGYEIDNLKTEGSNRNIPICDLAIDILKKHKFKQDKLKKSYSSKYLEKDLVNCERNGDIIIPTTFSKRFSNYLKKNNLKHIRFHDLRHSYATNMLGIQDTKTTSTIMGHSNSRITLDIYSHVTPEKIMESSNLMNQLLEKVL